MSTIDLPSYPKVALNASSSLSSTSESQTPFYKKEKQILLEFDVIVRGKSSSSSLTFIAPLPARSR